MNEHTHSSEQNFHEQPQESTKHREQAADSIDALFDAMEDISEVIVARLKDPQTDKAIVQADWVAHKIIAERIAEVSPKPEYSKNQIRALVLKARIFRDAGDPQRYLEELQDAEEYAYNAGFDDASASLLAEIEAISR